LQVQTVINILYNGALNNNNGKDSGSLPTTVGGVAINLLEIISRKQTKKVNAPPIFVF
jgi:hypothetical protein